MSSRGQAVRHDVAVAEDRRRGVLGAPGRLIGRVADTVVPTIVDRVDVGEVVERIDPNELLERVDPNELLDRIDVDRLLERIDVDALVGRIDVNHLLDRVDVDRLLDRVEPDRLLDRVDVDRMLERVDVNQIVERTELGAVIARSTTGVFTELVDLVRVQLTALDVALGAVPARLLRRRAKQVPGRPGAPDDRPALPRGDRWQWASLLQRHHAGMVSRFLAFVVDQFLIGLLFAAGAALVAAASDVVLGRTVDLADGRWLAASVFAAWSFLYVAGQLATSGRTVGKALLGLRVVGAEGDALTPRRAMVRTLVFPLGFLLFGVGFLVALGRSDRRALHDLIARTAVIYDWDAQTARTRAASHPPLTSARAGDVRHDSDGLFPFPSASHGAMMADLHEWRGGTMFVQVITGTVRDREQMSRLRDRWQAELRPGATGFLGGTAGLTDAGELVNVARFASREAAQANAQRSEQGAWWDEVRACFADEPVFRESDDVDIYENGDLDRAGFVQVMEGRLLEPEAARALGSEMQAILGRERPDVLGRVQVFYPDGTFTNVVYFTSEEDARAAERSEWSTPAAELMQRMEQVMDVTTYLDLRDLWLV